MNELSTVWFPKIGPIFWPFFCKTTLFKQRWRSHLPVIELFGTDYLPWSNVENLDTMFYMKECFFNHKYDDVVFHGKAVPRDLIKIMREIDKIDGANRPNYEEHEKVLEKLIKDFKVDYYAPFEWADALAKFYFIKEQKEEELKERKLRSKKRRTGIAGSKS
ncbi:hypothetical protein Y032_1028g3435 [Ancylostoma ceylanicum]|uniref:Uncharacterized protein n=1 Tax=Ancylostoma ceylanicum TaxID=53326 RepID=A0A016W9A9_9BILA|nr:hypothetical protein Y032_1028g3435 [Ancylostoma ceylanicum]